MALNTANVAITPGSGTNIETESVTSASGTGDRQRVQISGRAGSAVEATNDVATVLAADPAAAEYGLTVRTAGRTRSYCNSAPVITQITVGITATAVPSSSAANRRRIRVRNLDASNLNAIYVGNAGVTLATGFKVFPGETFDANYGPGVLLYAVAENAAVLTSVLEDVE